MLVLLNISSRKKLIEERKERKKCRDQVQIKITPLWYYNQLCSAFSFSIHAQNPSRCRRQSTMGSCTRITPLTPTPSSSKRSLTRSAPTAGMRGLLSSKPFSTTPLAFPSSFISCRYRESFILCLLICYNFLLIFIMDCDFGRAILIIYVICLFNL